ncbi:helix-turn-helix domain-containing protein [Pseudothauera rhizosphaerae]|uniref:XRE family transcriptional regulator n=1 Tax=Pseudothauera rhizosphaerae TaxID=2565932 RepID=A0A4S4AMV9_9RHOO|nr:helix-turn-helix transcriptional regulator [Pseudothauera rhizosphaerae]THF60940.1 XRE family transcriptional regulator [Pseudothauera rhizosphaerae]
MAGNDPTPAVDWKTLLHQAVADANQAGGRGGVTRVARCLGVSRAYVSQALNGLRPHVPPAFIARVIDRLHVVAECPASNQPQPRSECRRLALGAAPTHNPLAMRFWKACQSCPHRPEETA